MSDQIYAEREIETDVDSRVDQLAWRLLRVTTITGEVSVWTETQRRKVIETAQREGKLREVRARVRELRQNVTRELLVG